MQRTYSPLFVLVFAAHLTAQLQTGRITGTVRGTGGSAIPEAQVTLTRTLTGTVHSARTSSAGIYSVPALEPGDYAIEASAPGFGTETRRIAVPVGSALREDFALQAQQGATQSRNAGQPETQAQERIFNEREIRQLPSLTRNPFEFAALSANVSDAGLGTRGVGLAIDGQRESSTFVLLDGAGNMNEFNGSAGQPVPLDAMQEFSIVTSTFTAEYGRASGGIVNAVSKMGGNSLHGTAYEFNRVSALSSGSFKDNANGVRQADFARNQFGYSAGGAIRPNKLFFFNATEGLLVRSNATNFAWVPTPQLLSNTAANTQAYFQALGQLRPGARQIGTATLNDLAKASGRNPCTGFACATLPADLPLFSHIAYSAPADSGGGTPQTTWNTVSRVDYNVSEKTRIYARYALYSEDDPAGTLSSSPYSNYDLGQTQFDNSFLASLTRIWNPRRVSNTSISFERLNIVQQGLTSRGVVPGMYANPFSPVVIGNDSVVFPGYNPFSAGTEGTFGGPQNTGELNHDTSWVIGSHTLRFGGNYRYIRDNRTDAAFQTALGSLSSSAGIGPALNGLLSGRFAHVQVAVNPQVLPGSVSPPDFSRSNRFHDGALYVQDYWKPFRRLTVNAGVRWEHFGVQHNGNPNLDSNWYASGVGFADTNLAAYLRQGGLQTAPKSSVGQLWKPDWKDFAPRVGFAWDVFGDGRTALRAGYGIGYDRNFGNVTFNVIQNGPNYATIDVPGPIGTSNYGLLSGGSSLIPQRSGARIIDPDLKTAYAHFWSATVDREVLRGVTYSLGYSGSKGVNLYSISYPNQAGFGNAVLGDQCTGNGDCTSQPNPNYSEDVGYRGNQGFSTYYGITNQVTMRDFLHRGILLTATYTWSHAVDNLSSTFFEAGGTGVQGLNGNQNITTNNGYFVQGLLDPYHPNLDRGDAEFDVRHRVTVAGTLPVPAYNRTGWMGTVLNGWSLNPVFIGRSGQPFSVFDSSAQTLDLNTPRALFVQSVSTKGNSFVPSTTPDTFHFLTFLPAQIGHVSNLLTPGSVFPANMSRRDAFRAPGFWNLNLGVYKDTKITDRFTVQLRGEAFNLVNHANLYLIGATADVGRGNTVDACFGCSGSTWDRRQIQLAARLIF